MNERTNERTNDRACRACERHATTGGRENPPVRGAYSRRFRRLPTHVRCSPVCRGLTIVSAAATATAARTTEADTTRHFRVGEREPVSVRPRRLAFAGRTEKKSRVHECWRSPDTHPPTHALPPSASAGYSAAAGAWRIVLVNFAVRASVTGTGPRYSRARQSQNTSRPTSVSLLTRSSRPP
ncbi:hypothetical protein ALC60_14164 [Trachymyrmex zeteki]|uniref:Uncharacterized protein n=1 Tax=Mycetomoellerius zeteki TaxID=64791 RepID=A0A151WG50_9HYME|nr:hypothetical protein ALC60_14164 [Trachymyrmex zeteki]